MRNGDGTAARGKHQAHKDQDPEKFQVPKSSMNDRFGQLNERAGWVGGPESGSKLPHSKTLRESGSGAGHRGRNGAEFTIGGWEKVFGVAGIFRSRCRAKTSTSSVEPLAKGAKGRREGRDERDGLAGSFEELQGPSKCFEVFQGGFRSARMTGEFRTKFPRKWIYRGAGGFRTGTSAFQRERSKFTRTKIQRNSKFQNPI